MAAKIRLETDNATRPGFSEAVAGLKELSDKAGITTNAAKELSKALDKQKYKEFRDEVSRVTAEMSGTVRAMSQAEQQAQDLNKELESRKAAAYRMEIKRLADELDGTAAAAKRAQAAMDKVKGPGNLASGKMGFGGGGAGGSVDKAANAFAKVGGDAAAGIGGALGSAGGPLAAAAVYFAIKAGFEAAKAAVEGTSAALDALKEHGNKAASDLVDSFSEVKVAMLDLGDDPAFRQLLMRAAEIIRQDIIPGIGSMSKEWGKQLDNMVLMSVAFQQLTGQITKSQAEMIARSLKAGAISRDEIIKTQVAQEKADRAAKAAAEETAKIKAAAAKAEKEAAEFQDAIDKGHAEWMKKEADKLHDQALAKQDEVALQQKRIDDARLQRLDDERERKEQMWEREAAEIEKRKPQLEAATKNLMGSLDPRKLREQYVSVRARKEMGQFDANAEKRLKDLTYDDPTEGQSAALDRERSKIARERIQSQRQTRFNSYQKFNQGRATDEDKNEAVSELAKKQVEGMRGRAGVDDITVKTVEKIIDAQTEQNNFNASITQQMKALNDRADQNQEQADATWKGQMLRLRGQRGTGG